MLLRFSSQHPGVFANAAGAVGDKIIALCRRAPGETAGHDDIAIRPRHRKAAQDGMARFQLAVDKTGRGRKAHLLLPDKISGVRFDLGAQLGQLFAAQTVAKDRAGDCLSANRFDHQLGQMVKDIIQFGAFTTPVRCCRR